MTDRVAPAVRSAIMARIRGKDTKPELIVRRALFVAGYRYRLHRRDLAGCPDLVLTRYRTAVFVHGCFWHGHDCPRGRRPASNVAFWHGKLDRNMARDLAARQKLRTDDWHVVTIWQCQVVEGTRDLLVRLNGARARLRSEIE